MCLVVLMVLTIISVSVFILTVPGQYNTWSEHLMQIETRPRIEACLCIEICLRTETRIPSES